MNGTVHISELALASLIGLSAHEIPGVVGMAPANLREGLQRVLGRAQASDGVTISKEGEQLNADLYIVVAYGVNIPAVANNISEKVSRVLKTQAGVSLGRLKIHAVGVRHV